MTEVIPKYDELMWPTLKAISTLGGSASIEEIQDQLVSDEKFTDEQLALTYPKSGAAVLPDRMSWARSYLRLAGLLDNPKKGVWVLTEQGRVYAQSTSLVVPQAVKDVIKQSQKRTKLLAGNNLDALGNADIQADLPDWSSRLLERLKLIEPAAFERLCQRLLRQSGFIRVEVTGRSGDGGIDGTGVLRVQLISFHVLFQCKRYAGSVGASVVRDFRGAMQGRADKGLIMTTGTFTAKGRREATRDGAPAIDLIDGDALCQLMKELGLGVVVSKRVIEEIDIDNVFFDAV